MEYSPMNKGDEGGMHGVRDVAVTGGWNRVAQSVGMEHRLMGRGGEAGLDDGGGNGIELEGVKG